MKIGVDIDGTVKDTHRAAIEVYNKELNRSVTLEDAPDFYLDKAYGLSSDEGGRLWRKLEETIYELGLPLDHASEVLNDLVKRGHTITFITARPDIKNIRAITITWLKKHGFPYTGDNLVMNSQDKARVAKEKGIELFFEDAPEHLDNLIENGIRTIIVDASYNQQYPASIPRIKDWLEVYGHIGEKK
jgi:uncharacterized protein